MKTIKKFLLIFSLVFTTTSIHALDIHALGDSLDRWAGFNLGCIPSVQVTQLKTKQNRIWVYTNKTLSGLSLSPNAIKQLRTQVSCWVLGNSHGKVTIYSDDYELGDLVTTRYKNRPKEQHYPIPNKKNLGYSLNGQYIALWPSHGIYYNRDEDRWKLQRATMWTTVEDMYTTAYAEQVSLMLERAGATVLSPRARYGKDTQAEEIGPSGFPRWAEGARYWLEYTGVPDTIWNPISDKKDPAKDSVRNDYLDDIRCRGFWVNYLTGGSSVNPKQEGKGIPISVCLALHTDGYSQVGDSQTIGTLAIYSRQDYFKKTSFPTGQDRILNRDLADFIQTQVVQDIQQQFAPTWKRRQLHNAGYFEARSPVVPTVLLEILSHKQMADIRHGLRPQFRQTVARAIYKGVGRWIHAQVGTEFIVQPLRVQKMSISLEEKNLIVSWQPTEDPIESSARPTYYLVEIRENDNPWCNAIKVKKTTYTIHAKQGVRYDVRITAGNEGGTSDYGETLSAFLGEPTQPTVLIVNAFNRIDGPQWWVDSLRGGIVPNSYAIPDGEDGIYIGEQYEYDRSLDWVSDDACGWGMCYRDRTGTRQVGNTHDYAVLHGRALQELGYSFVSTNSQALDSISGEWAFVDFIVGKDSLSAIQHLSNWQGKSLISCAYSGNISRATRTGLVRLYDRDYRFDVTPNAQRLCTEFPTGQTARKGQRVIARYSDSGVPACVLTPNCIQWSVPLESFEDFESIYKQTIHTLLAP